MHLKRESFGKNVVKPVFRLCIPHSKHQADGNTASHPQKTWWTHPETFLELFDTYLDGARRVKQTSSSQKTTSPL